MRGALDFIEAFLGKYPKINTAVRALVTAVITAVLLELGLDSVASEVVNAP